MTNRQRAKRTRQGIVLVVFSLASAVVLIAHGVFFDLDFDEVKRVTLFGVIVTSVVVFPVIRFIEWVFDWDNNEQLKEIEARVAELERRHRDDAERAAPLTRDVQADQALDARA